MMSGGFVGLAGLALSMALVSGTAVSAQDAPGVVALECDVKPDGYFEPCRVLSEPDGGGFGQIALARAAVGRITVPPEGIEAGAIVRFEVGVEAPLPQALWPTEADLRPGVIVAPQWDTPPELVFPTRASQRYVVSGQARVRCVVASDGALTDCVVLSENPVGADFGAAILTAATTARLSADSVASARPGAIVEISSTFRLAE